jgi:FkbM family methyltransferase
MKKQLAKIAKTTLRKFDLALIKYQDFQRLEDYNKILNIPNKKLSKLMFLADKSKSQLKQDLFVLSELDFKRNGFFVEFGATNGIDLSNTYLLETEFGWNGILAEPAKCWHKELKENRRCYIETNCVWHDSTSILTFNEVEAAELSTISSYSNCDRHQKTRRSGHSYNVNTISLTDLLKKYNAPKEIDYLSIDTEGSEYEILNNFDFSDYQFKVITCEHNFTPNRKKIEELLTHNGYSRKYTSLSQFDDWYIKI